MDTGAPGLGTRMAGIHDLHLLHRTSCTPLWLSLALYENISVSLLLTQNKDPFPRHSFWGKKRKKKKVPKIKLLIFYLAINQVTTMVKFSYSVSGVLAFHLCFFDLSRVLQQYYSIYACDLLSWTTFIKTCLNTISQGLKLTSGLGSEIVNLFSVIVKTRQNVVLLHLILLLSLLRFLFFRHLQCCKILPLISLEDKQLGADLSHVKFGAGLIFCITLLLDYTCLEQRQRTFCPCESGFNWDLWYALGIKIGIIALPGFCFKNSSPNP